MTSNNTEQRLRVTYTHDDEFIIPHGIDLNDDTQVISYAVKWNILHIKLKDGKTLEIEAEGQIHDYDYKYPDNEEIVEIEIEPTIFKKTTEPDTSHLEYCEYCHDINNNMSEESIKELDPPPLRVKNFNGEWMCYYCDDMLRDWTLTPETEEDPIPLQDGDGHDTKCFYCNATGCDAWMTKGEDKHPVHQDCFAD